ncbi:alpha/beta fold hydrolase [Nonomuraea endophytica]|uniref:alpha/beta fold hydrolase n=1 Tax=Nonomuraea endophytica TaxID=714136 RepID=UPI0037CBEB50
MSTVRSQDGTTIAYDRIGEGPALVIIGGGGATDRSVNAPLAGLLADSFTVYNYDRRGSGESGDTEPFTVERVYQDLDAVIREAGGQAYVFGSSGGGIIGLEAVLNGLPITRLAIWEAPYIVDDSRPPVPADYLDRLIALREQGRRGDMVELFLTAAVGLPAEFVTPMRGMPMWPGMEKAAHTLIYDAMVVGDFSLSAERMAGVAIPALVLDGGTLPWATNSAEALAAALPAARRETLAGQPHNVDAAALAPALRAFFAS